MTENVLFVFQIQGENIMSRFWLSVKLEMAIKQTKQSVLRDVCVSTSLQLFYHSHFFLKLRYEMKICILFASFSG